MPLHAIVFFLAAAAASSVAGIAGRVETRDGAPIASATVTAIAPDGRTAAGVTDSSGRFRLEALPAPEVALHASAPGFRAFVTLPVPDGAGEVVIALGRCVLFGRVERPDGEPSLDAAVVASPRLAPGETAGRSFAARVAADGSGLFGLDLDPGAYLVRATSETDADSEPIEIEIGLEGGPPARLSLRLSRAGSLEGRIALRADGRTVPSAFVRCVPLRPDDSPKDDGFVQLDPAQRRSIPGERTARSADDGSFSFAGLDPGTYRLEITGAEIVGRRSDVFRVFEGDSIRGVEVGVERYGSIEGRAFDENGRALAGLYADASRHFRAGILSTVPVRDDGSFRLERLPPGTYDVYLLEPTSPTRKDVVDHRPAAVRDGATSLVEFGSPPEDPTPFCRVRGLATDGRGPLALAFVQLLTGAESKGIAGTAGADGRFEFAGVRPGEYTLEILPSGGRAAFEEPVVVPDALEWRHDVRAPTGAIEGRVLAAGTGTPVPLAALSARLASGGARSEVRADGGGRFRIEPLRTGRYRVKAAESRGLAADERAPRWAAAEVEVVEGATSALDLSVAPSAALEVLVRDATGMPVSSAVVWIETPSDPAIRSWPFGIDPEPGRHDLESLPAGEGTLFALSPMHAPVRTRLALVPGTRARESIVLVSGGALRVTLEDESGNPVAGASVRLRDAVGALVPRRAPGLREPPVFEFAAGPRVEFPHLEPGRYSIAATKTGVGSAAATLEVENGRPTESRLVLRPPR